LFISPPPSFREILTKRIEKCPRSDYINSTI
jgi:hypothetical protein